MITRITNMPGKTTDPADRDQTHVPADAITSSDQPHLNTRIDPHQERAARAERRRCACCRCRGRITDCDRLIGRHSACRLRAADYCVGGAGGCTHIIWFCASSVWPALRKGRLIAGERTQQRQARRVAERLLWPAAQTDSKHQARRRSRSTLAVRGKRLPPNRAGGRKDRHDRDPRPRVHAEP